MRGLEKLFTILFVIWGLIILTIMGTGVFCVVHFIEKAW